MSDIMMLTRLAILLGATAAVLAALPAAAAPDGTLPSIDLVTRCKKSEKTQIEMMANQSLKGTAFDACMQSEEEARKALVTAWPSIPRQYKTFCVRTKDFSPSYIEWIACLEMMIDLRKQRATSNSKPADALDRCPVIRYADDGSIKRISACAR